MIELMTEDDFNIDVDTYEECLMLQKYWRISATQEAHDIFAELFNIGIMNSRGEGMVFVPEGPQEEAIIELLTALGLVNIHYHNDNAAYTPSMLYGMYGEEICHTLAKLIEEQAPLVSTVHDD